MSYAEYRLSLMKRGPKLNQESFYSDPKYLSAGLGIVHSPFMISGLGR